MPVRAGTLRYVRDGLDIIRYLGRRARPRPQGGTRKRHDVPCPATLTRVRNRTDRLRSLGWRDYRDYRRSIVWRSVQDDFRRAVRPPGCFYCADPRYQVHHLTFARVGGSELLGDLYAVCPSCRDLVSVLERRRGPYAATTPSQAFLTQPLHRQLAAVRQCGTPPTVRAVEARIKLIFRTHAEGANPQPDLEALARFLTQLMQLLPDDEGARRLLAAA